MNLENVSDFARAVYLETLKIPRGETRSYKEIAITVGRPTASRAVAQALKHNPYPITIPCHRVISSRGQTIGYFGAAGASKGAALLASEQK